MELIEKNDEVWQAVVRILDNYLESTRHRKTAERYTILDAVYSIAGHFTLEELGNVLTENYRFIVSTPTLYNTLKLFLELRLVVRHRFQGTTKYEACYATKSHCHQICSMCGKVTEVQSPLIDQAIEQTRLSRFRRDGYSLYIYGVCSVCQAKVTRQNRRRQKKAEKEK